MTTPADTARQSITDLLSADFFKALADPNRLAILAALAMGGRQQTVSEIAARCPVNISVVSRHLKILRAVGILHSEKRGKQVLYHARVPHIVALLRHMADALETCCTELPSDGATPTKGEHTP